MKISDKKNNIAQKALADIQKESKRNGTNKMSLDEINEEIAKARKDRKTK